MDLETEPNRLHAIRLPAHRPAADRRPAPAGIDLCGLLDARGPLPALRRLRDRLRGRTFALAVSPAGGRPRGRAYAARPNRGGFGSGGRTRTYDMAVNSRPL